MMQRRAQRRVGPFWVAREMLFQRDSPGAEIGSGPVREVIRTRRWALWLFFNYTAGCQVKAGVSAVGKGNLARKIVKPKAIGLGRKRLAVRRRRGSIRGRALIGRAFQPSDSIGSVAHGASPHAGI